MFRGDGSANLSATAPPKMVLPMFLQLGLGTPAGTKSQADIRLLIPQFDPVNPEFFRVTPSWNVPFEPS